MHPPPFLPPQPCPDVYQFPLFSERFCSDLLAEAQQSGGWNRGQQEVSRAEMGNFKWGPQIGTPRIPNGDPKQGPQMGTPVALNGDPKW